MKMVRDSVKSGANEQVMWHAVEVADNMLSEIKESHPERYDYYMRQMTQALFGCHYTESIAMSDVDDMHHTDSNGEVVSGLYWTPDQVEEAWVGKPFPKGTTKFDKFVAANAIWHDLNGEFDDEQILDIAYRIFFADEDSNLEGKVWKYMSISK